MKSLQLKLLTLVFSLLLTSLLISANQANAESTTFSGGQTQITHLNEYDNDRVMRLAISLARAAGELSVSESHNIYRYFYEGKSLSEDLKSKLADYLYIAQSHILFLDLTYVFQPKISLRIHAQKDQQAVVENKLTESIRSLFGIAHQKSSANIFQDISQIEDTSDRQWLILKTNPAAIRPAARSDIRSSRYNNMRSTYANRLDTELVLPPLKNISVLEDHSIALLKALESLNADHLTHLRTTYPIVAQPEAASYSVISQTALNAKKMLEHFSSLLNMAITVQIELNQLMPILSQLTIEHKLPQGQSEVATQDSLRALYLHQLILNHARSLAQKKLNWQPNSYQPAETQLQDLISNVLQTNDSQIARFILKKPFHVIDPKPHTHDFITSAFELESLSELIVMLILPRDPSLRTRWHKMNLQERTAALAKLGFQIDQEFTYEKYYLFTSEFFGDVNQFEFLSPELHLEGSGNWEIKSKLAGLSGNRATSRAIETIERIVPRDDFRLHMHKFIPAHKYSGLTADDSDRFVDFIERLSFYMLVSGYDEAPLHHPNHFYDSWGLDRYSIKDLQSVQDHLLGVKKLAPKDQKYHNVAFRPVRNGLDLELRDIANDVQFGSALGDRIERALLQGDFGSIKFSDDPPLFMGFGENNPDYEKQFTLQTAVSERHSVTAAQAELLRQFQFEIYKPSMRDQVFFIGTEITTYEETFDQDLDTKYVRTNFENNIALPLLNYDQQSFITQEEKEIIRQHRTEFIEKVWALLLQVDNNPEYAFMKSTTDYLHLADWLRRSTHPSKPNFAKVVSSAERERQNQLIEDLTYKLRAMASVFVKKTQILKIAGRSLNIENIVIGPPVTQPMAIKRPAAQSLPEGSACADALSDRE